MNSKVIKTRSQRIEDLDKLSSFFYSSQEEAQTFCDALKGTVQESAHSETPQIARQIVSENPDKVKAPQRLAEHLSGFIRIFCGQHRSDYVWHIEHAAIRRPWKVSNERVIYIIAKIMHESLPDIEAKIWPPQVDWELRTITFKAIGLADVWSFHQSDVEKINQKLFTALNPLV
jgi:hypothetical protein